MGHPYKTLPATAYWRSAVADAGVLAYRDLWKARWPLPADARFATFGSCFAQHLSRALVSRGMNWHNAEPAPPRTPPLIAQKYNYGVFSARTGNIYTAAQLLAWTRLALDPEAGLEKVELWESPQGRWFDAMRPAIEPEGFASRQEALLSLRSTAAAFRRSFVETDLFIFTLGLTEGWENTATGQVYALCPGTAMGEFDPDIHRFRNYRVGEIVTALDQAFTLMRRANPTLRILLTVSPVPLVATASGDHVLVATTYSKSVLRAVAGEMCEADSGIDYFPSYEIIAAPPTRAMFFEPNMRSVAPQGVDLVMSHFFSGLDLSGPARHGGEPGPAPEAEVEREMEQEDLVCEEMILDQYNKT